ncbi:hypothetical protein [Methylobacterium radiotolerans]
MPEVEYEIVQLSNLNFEDLVERGRILEKSHSHFVRPESLIYFLRNSRSDNDNRRFNALYGLVLRRLLLALPRCERTVDGVTHVDAAASDVEDRVRGRFVELLSLDRAGGGRMDFYEVHFDEAVAKLRMKAVKAIGARTRRTTGLEEDPDSGDVPEFVEQAAGSFEEPDDAFLRDPIFRKRVLVEIDLLKPEHKQVITMLLANMPSESNNLEVPTISRALGCDARTVRNRRRDAIVVLRKALILGEDK